MDTFGYELEEEFSAIAQFLEKKYGIIIKSKEQLINFTQKSLTFMMAIKVWKKNLVLVFKNAPRTEVYFQEMLSNAIHIILLGNMDMKIPALLMLRRTQELILTYLYYSEHTVELFKKEMDDNSRAVSGFNELKDYIKSYPFSMKYRLNDEKVQEVVSKIIDDWTRQYKDLSNFVKKDVNFLAKQVELLSSTVNALLIVFYFQEYIKFDENTEKSIIRGAISNEFGYKKKIVEVFNEI